MLFPEFSFSPSGSQIWPISYRYIIQPISYSKLSTLVLRIFQTSLLKKLITSSDFVNSTQYSLDTLWYGCYPYLIDHIIWLKSSSQNPMTWSVFSNREVWKILKTKVESLLYDIGYIMYLYDMGQIQDPDGEIENSGKAYLKSESRTSVTFKLQFLT